MKSGVGFFLAFLSGVASFSPCQAADSVNIAVRKQCLSTVVEISADSGPSESSLSELCSGATSAAPVDCYREAVKSLHSSRALILCIGAIDLTPIDCLEQFKNSSLSETVLANVCATNPGHRYPNN